MEWTRAKKYTIIILLLLNAILFGLNMYQKFETRLSSSRINAVTSVLEEKGITIASTLPRNYKPMADMSTSEIAFDYIKLQKIFMSGQSDVKRTDEYNSVVFMSDTSKVAIKGSTINYTSENSVELSDESSAKAYAQNMIDSINKYFGNYSFHSIYKIDGGYSIKYYEKINNHNVFSNFAYFTIKGKNVALAMNYLRTGNELSGKNNIYGADEALYSAADLIAAEIKDPRITKVELGYYAIKLNSGSDEVAVPFYLIVANNKEYYVNAYTGESF